MMQQGQSLCRLALAMPHCGNTVVATPGMKSRLPGTTISPDCKRRLKSGPTFR